MPQRREIPEIPYDALREALINAVAHRDYFEKGANVMVEIFDDRIDISNPGGLVKGMSPKDLGKKSVLRNPNIASLLHRVGYIEKMGTGVTKMRKLMRETGLSPPLFESGYFFTVTFRRPGKKKAVREKPRIVGQNEGVNEGVNRLYEFICDHPGKRTSEISKVLNVPQKTIERWIHKLKSEQKITFVGSPKTGGYEKNTK